MQNTNDNDSGHESTCTNNPWIICIFLITFFVKKIIWRWEFQRRFRVRHGRIACCWKGIPMGTMEFLLWHHCFLCTQNNIFRFLRYQTYFCNHKYILYTFQVQKKVGQTENLPAFDFEDLKSFVNSTKNTPNPCKTPKIKIWVNHPLKQINQETLESFLTVSDFSFINSVSMRDFSTDDILLIYELSMQMKHLQRSWTLLLSCLFHWSPIVSKDDVNVISMWRL